MFPDKTSQNAAIAFSFSLKLNDLMARHSLNLDQAGSMLGVPRTTLIHWMNCKRTPSASALRLLDLISMVESSAPELFTSLVPDRADFPNRKRGRPAKVALVKVAE